MSLKLNQKIICIKYIPKKQGEFKCDSCDLNKLDCQRTPFYCYARCREDGEEVVYKIVEE